MDNKPEYPIIKANQGLIDVVDQDPLAYKIPVKPTAPHKPLPLETPKLPYRPLPRKLEESSFSTFGCMPVVLFILFFILANIKPSGFNIFLAILSFLILALLFIFGRHSNEEIESHKKHEAELPQKIQEWEIECARIESEHNQKINKQNEDYELALSHYNNYSLVDYEKKLKEFQSFLKSKEGRFEFFNKRYDDVGNYNSKHCSGAVEYPYPETPRKGVSENSFVKYIEENWNSTFSLAHGTIYISTNKTIAGSRFLPDITLEYLIYRGHIRIDVEIDEPYVGSTGQPIHYLESTDNKRDDFFIKHGWIVVRFAEEQVVKSPESCFTYLVKVITGITGRAIENKSWLDIESRIDPHLLLPKVKRWTKDEAHAMAFRRYRNTYLAKEFIEHLNAEEVPEE